MKRLLLILALFVLVTACAKEDIPVIIVTEPVKEPPKQVPPPAPVIEPMHAPEQIQDVVLPEPVSEPMPVPSGRPTCKILQDSGKVYTSADVDAGIISDADFNNLRMCYPYFSAEQTDTLVMCCII